MGLGFALILLSLALLFVPVVPQSSQHVVISIDSPDGGWYQLTENVSGYSITGVVPVVVTWTSSAAIDVDAATCAGYCDNVNQVASTMQVESLSTRGSFFLNQPNGGSVFLAWAQQGIPPAAVNVTYSIWTGLAFAGSVLLGLGSVALFLGLLLPPKKDVLSSDVALYPRDLAPAKEMPKSPPKTL